MSRSSCSIVNFEKCSKCIRGINAKGAGEKFSRKDIDALTAFVQEQGAKGLAWMKVEPDKLNSSIAKFFSDDLQSCLRQVMKAETVLFVADGRTATHAPLAALRNRLRKELALHDSKDLHFSFVDVVSKMSDRRDDVERTCEEIQDLEWWSVFELALATAG